MLCTVVWMHERHIVIHPIAPRPHGLLQTHDKPHGTRQPGSRPATYIDFLAPVLQITTPKPWEPAQVWSYIASWLPGAMCNHPHGASKGYLLPDPGTLTYSYSYSNWLSKLSNPPGSQRLMGDQERNRQLPTLDLPNSRKPAQVWSRKQGSLLVGPPACSVLIQHQAIPIPLAESVAHRCHPSCCS